MNTSTTRRLAIAALGAAALALSPGAPIAAKSVPPSLGQSLAKQGYVAVPLRRMQTGLLGVDVSINGQQGLFMVDTGAGATVVDHNQLARFGMSDPVREGTGIGAGGEVKISVHRITSFAIGGRPTAMSRIFSADLGPAVAQFKQVDHLDVSGIVGQDFLLRYSCVIDVKGLTLYFKLP